MTLALIAPGWDTRAWAEAIRAAAPDRDLRVFPELGATDEIDYALVWKPPHGLLRTLPSLTAVFNLGAGVDHLLADESLPDVPIVRVVDPNLTQRMSEYVLLHVLMHHRRQRLYDAQQARRVWRDRKQWAAERLRVGVMGLGVLGTDAATKLALVGFDVAGWSRTEKRIEGIATFHGQGGLAPFLARTDILVSLLPLTPETKGLLNRSLFEKLAHDGVLGGPVLINCGRGGAQVEADILAALEDGTLSAATLDVFEEEPLPPASPLWNHPRVTITPHNAADSEPEALAAYVLGEIGRFEAGEALRNRVDRARGY